MPDPTSADQVLAWGKEHGAFFLGAVTLGITTAGGLISVTKHIEGLRKDLEHERQLRKQATERLQERIDLTVKNQLFDILHHADYKAATRLLKGCQASPAERPSTD